jgi:hypothetical protein
MASEDGNRSDSENLSLETLSSPVVPCCHGYASLIAPGSLGTNATRSASLYWRAGGPCGRLGGQSALVRGTGPPLTGPAQPEHEACFTPSIERSASVATSKAPTRSAPSWGATGSSGPYSPPHPGGSCRGGRRSHAGAGSRWSRPFIRGRSHAVSSPRDGDAPAPAGRDGVSVASAGVSRLWRDHARALACGRAQGHLRSPGARHGGPLHGGVSFVQAHDWPGAGGRVRCADACGDGQPVGAGHDTGVSPPRRGRPRWRCSARGGPPRRDQRAAGRQRGVVMGGGDEPCDRVCGAPVSRWAGGS